VQEYLDECVCGCIFHFEIVKILTESQGLDVAQLGVNQYKTSVSLYLLL